MYYRQLCLQGTPKLILWFCSVFMLFKIRRRFIANISSLLFTLSRLKLSENSNTHNKMCSSRLSACFIIIIQNEIYSLCWGCRLQSWYKEDRFLRSFFCFLQRFQFSVMFQLFINDGLNLKTNKRKTYVLCDRWQRNSPYCKLPPRKN